MTSAYWALPNWLAQGLAFTAAASFALYFGWRLVKRFYPSR